jgi:hypothetical protein
MLASGSAAPRYEPRTPETAILYRTVQSHLETFLAETAGQDGDAGLPGFVKREFEANLRCGILAHGFARVRCAGCALERFVPFSCKGRGFCPSCGGRRMTERAAHLVEAVLPRVPVRQWVLTLPYRLRYRLAWDHGLARAVLGVYAPRSRPPSPGQPPWRRPLKLPRMAPRSPRRWLTAQDRPAIALPLLCQGLAEHYGPAHVRPARPAIAGDLRRVLTGNTTP